MQLSVEDIADNANMIINGYGKKVLFYQKKYNIKLVLLFVYFLC